MKKFPEFEIAGRKVGYNYDPLVIAELGINHGGSLKEAKKIVDENNFFYNEQISKQNKFLKTYKKMSYDKVLEFILRS